MLDDLSTIIVHDPLPIERELRTWVVDGHVSALVGYKVGSKILPWEEPPDSDLYQEICAFVTREVAKIQDNTRPGYFSSSTRALGAFVLDVAITPDGLKTVEINCIHSAGFYLTAPILDVVADLYTFVKKH